MRKEEISFLDYWISTIRLYGIFCKLCYATSWNCFNWL